MLSFAIVASVLSMTLFQSALSAACRYDGECNPGQFCETDQYLCQDCLNCEDLKREPSNAGSSCIRSVSECGACLKGLVEDRYDELKCVPPKEGESSNSSTAMWVVIGVFVVILVIIGAAFLTYRWKTRKTKSHSINNDTILPVISASYPQPPTAPESPPPYRPSSDIYQPGEVSDSDHPLIKIRPSPPLYAVSDGPQKANVYNPPAYVRYGNQDDFSPPEEVNDVNDNYVDQDEATTESVWTPGPSSNEATATEASSSEPVAANNKLSTALAVARTTELIQPPAKRTKTMDPNEDVNGGEEEVHETTQDGASRSAAQQFNIVIQVNQKII